MLRIFTILFLSSFCLVSINAQTVIRLANPSFEDQPHPGLDAKSKIKGWNDCGRIYFSGESPPDIHQSWDPNAKLKEGKDIFFNVQKRSSHGFTFLGMVTRNNDSYESVCQRLEKPLEAGNCYSFSIDLSRSLKYKSKLEQYGPEMLFVKPIVLRIYGGSTPCGKRELLAESKAVKNSDWQKYEFKFTPKNTHRYFSLVAFYKVPVLLPYNGNLLLDNASNIVQIECPGEEVEEPAEEIVAEKPVKIEKPTRVKPKVEKPVEDVVVASPPVVKKPEPKMVINKELDKKTLTKGQIIKINNLYFDADSIVINPKSIPALEELASFLKYYPDVIIEIGGHTNGRPPHAFCDSLSEARAKSVAEFLYNKNIPYNQVQYKGYGKRKPVASDKYADGRRRNQRVEIKVLSLDS